MEMPRCAILRFDIFAFVVRIPAEAIKNKAKPSPVTEMEILAPNSTLFLALPLTICLTWGWLRLIIRC